MKTSDDTFVIPLNDNEAVQFLVDRKGESMSEARAKVKAWRKTATKMNYRGPIAWIVKGGFVFKVDAPKSGLTFDDLRYLQDWQLQNDEPTVDSLVFWIPKLAEGSTGKSYDEMVRHRGFLRKTYSLPANHCQSFGSISLLFALILSYYKVTKIRVPIELLYAASDTLDTDGDCLIAGSFSEGGLGCDGWDGDVDDEIGFFLVGVEYLDA